MAQQDIIKVLTKAGKPLTIKEISRRLKSPDGTVRKNVAALKKRAASEIETVRIKQRVKTKHGVVLYTVPAYQIKKGEFRRVEND